MRERKCQSGLLIRDGELGNYTKEPVIMWQCMESNIIWHELVLDNAKYYPKSRL